jgi:hypothetical protein
MELGAGAADRPDDTISTALTTFAESLGLDRTTFEIEIPRFIRYTVE